MAVVASESAAAFIEGIGVATHIPYTDGLYSNIDEVKAALAYLGVTHVRDGITDGEYGSAPLSSYIALAKAGVQFTFIGASAGASEPAQIDRQLSLIARVEQAVPGSVVAIEGPNEINNQPVTFDGLTGTDAALAAQRYLYAAVKASPTLGHVPVDYFTGYENGTGPDPSTTPGLADFDTQHPYPRHGQPPAAWVDPSKVLGNEAIPGPHVFTETGYSTKFETDYDNAVTPAVQAAFELDLLMDAARGGAAATYLYQLLDAYPTDSRQGIDGYGLFNYDESPKPAATAIHNLTAILADVNKPTGAVAPVTFAASGLPPSGATIALTKSDGTTDVVVWAEGTEPADVTLTLDAAHDYRIYDPLHGTSPIAIGRGQNVVVTVTDHPVIVEIVPAAGGTVDAPPPLDPTPPVVVSPPVTIPPATVDPSAPADPVATAPTDPVTQPASGSDGGVPASTAPTVVPGPVGGAAGTSILAPVQGTGVTTPAPVDMGSVPVSVDPIPPVLPAAPMVPPAAPVTPPWAATTGYAAFLVGSVANALKGWDSGRRGSVANLGDALHVQAQALDAEGDHRLAAALGGFADRWQHRPDVFDHLAGMVETDTAGGAHMTPQQLLVDLERASGYGHHHPNPKA